MSFCKDCTEHPDGFDRCCTHCCDQFIDKEGFVKSRVLACPHFKEKPGLNKWTKFMEEKYA